MAELTHFNEQGRARMVDVTEKAVTHRRAVAAGEIHMAPETLQNIKDGTLKKGDVLAVAQVAGIQAAKHNWELIPMCHPLPLTGIDITFALSDSPCMVEIQAAVTCTGVTGVEMEALSVEDGGAGICFHIYAYNSQPGVSIDYATGDSRLEGEAPVQTPAPSGPAAQTYVLNTSTRKFHLPGCASVDDMKEENRADYTGSRQELIDQGYSPCGQCKP